MATKNRSIWDRIRQTATSLWNNGKEKIAAAVTAPRAKISSLRRKYVPALMIFSGSLTAGAAPAQNTKDNIKAPNNKEIKLKDKSIRPDNNGIYYFKNMRIDPNNLLPEMLNMQFMTNNKFDAVYAPRGRVATIENATGFGPYLTRINDLRKFLTKYRDKYKEQYDVMMEKGINTNAFRNSWNKCNHSQMIEDLGREKWNHEFQPLLDKLSKKLGFDPITYEERASRKNFGFVAAVMTCSDQSSKVYEILVKSSLRARKKFGKNTTLDNIADESYLLRNEMYGLNKRYFGDKNTAGEMEANKLMREIVNQNSNTNFISKAKIQEVEQIQLQIDNKLVHSTDAIQPAIPDSTYWEVRDMYEKMEDGKSQVKAEFENNPYLNMTILDLQSRHGVLEKELDVCRKQLKEISTGKYTIMGHTHTIDYNNFPATHVSYLYESGLNPAQVALDGKAIGLPQFNFDDTAKTLVYCLSDEFPKLLQVMEKYGIRSSQFAAVWKECSFGPEKAKFEARQFDFMWDKFYKSKFKELETDYGMPEITKKTITDIDKKYWVYIASVISIYHQRPRSVTTFFKKARERLVAETHNQNPDPNSIGLVMQDIRDETWAMTCINKAKNIWKVKNRAMHRRFKGGNGVIGEKTLLENALRCFREYPRVFAHMQELENTMHQIELAMQYHKTDKVLLADKSAVKKAPKAPGSRKLAKATQKNVKIKKITNLKELFKARERAQRNLARARDNGGTQTSQRKYQGNPQKNNTQSSRRA